jgi:hypothetical protein
VRGGSWNNPQNNARCAYRNRNEPDNFNNNLGFRVVLSHDILPDQQRCTLRLINWPAVEVENWRSPIPACRSKARQANIQLAWSLDESWTRPSVAINPGGCPKGRKFVIYTPICGGWASPIPHI